MLPSRCSDCGYDLSGTPSGTCPECGTDHPDVWRCSGCGYDLTGARKRWGLATCPECGLENASGLPPRQVGTGSSLRGGLIFAALLVLLMIPPVGFFAAPVLVVVAMGYAAVLVWRKGWSGVWSFRDDARRGSSRH